MHYVFILFKFICYASLKKKKKKRKKKKKKKGGAEISHTIKKKMKREKISKRRSTANLDTNYNWPGFFIHSTLISLRPFCVLSINPNSFPPNPHSKIDLQQRLICTGQCNGGLQMSKGICFNFSYFVFSDRFFFFFWGFGSDPILKSEIYRDLYQLHKLSFSQFSFLCLNFVAQFQFSIRRNEKRGIIFSLLGLHCKSPSELC